MPVPRALLTILSPLVAVLTVRPRARRQCRVRRVAPVQEPASPAVDLAVSRARVPRLVPVRRAASVRVHRVSPVVPESVVADLAPVAQQVAVVRLRQQCRRLRARDRCLLSLPQVDAAAAAVAPVGLQVAAVLVVAVVVVVEVPQVLSVVRAEHPARAVSRNGRSGMNTRHCAHPPSSVA